MSKNGSYLPPPSSQYISSFSTVLFRNPREWERPGWWWQNGSETRRNRWKPAVNTASLMKSSEQLEVKPINLVLLQDSKSAFMLSGSHKIDGWVFLRSLLQRLGCLGNQISDEQWEEIKAAFLQFLGNCKRERWGIQGLWQPRCLRLIFTAPFSNKRNSSAETITVNLQQLLFQWRGESGHNLAAPLLEATRLWSCLTSC